jgi:hypothetical protein
MRQRCYNQVSSSYKWYGAQGVGVCDRGEMTLTHSRNGHFQMDTKKI